jgi:3-dehydroquinate synthetase
VRKILTAAGLPDAPAALVGAPFDPEALIARMRSDKKNKAGRLRLVLPSAPGRVEVVDEPKPERLLAFLKEHAA